VADKHILHMLSPLKHVSPFDVNMALDAGFDAVVPYEGVQLGDVNGLVQDAIFSRPPKAGVRTGVFIGGRDALLALDMMEAARKAMVPPFAVSLFADPAGSFTTAAAMVARAERTLKEKLGRELRGLRLAVFGATGVVGFASGVIAALEGAQVTLVGYNGPDRVAASAREIEGRFGVTLDSADGSTEERKEAILARSDAAFCAGRAGVQILSAAQVRNSPLILVADVNAVPPMGVEGLDVQADGVPLGGPDGGPDGAKTLGIGALAIGQTKYGTEIGLFKRMIEAAKPVRYDFRDAFVLARELAAG
jgi:methylene-tetrahydromethanopterin dehydrogenase